MKNHNCQCLPARYIREEQSAMNAVVAQFVSRFKPLIFSSTEVRNKKLHPSKKVFTFVLLRKYKNLFFKKLIFTKSSPCLF